MSPTEVALWGALVVLRNGGSTAMASQAYADLLAAFGEEGAEPFWRLDFVIAPLPGARVLVEPVGYIGSNLERVSAAMQLASSAVRGEVEASTLAGRIEEIEKRGATWGAWIRAAVGAIGAATFARSVGGDAGSMAVAAAAAGCGQVLRIEVLQRHGLPAMAEIFVGAIASALLAGGGLRLEVTDDLAATLVASVVCFVPGLALINGFVDLLRYEHLLIGLQRICYALAIFVALAVAIALSLFVAP